MDVSIWRDTARRYLAYLTQARTIGDSQSAIDVAPHALECPTFIRVGPGHRRGDQAKVRDSTNVRRRPHVFTLVKHKGLGAILWGGPRHHQPVDCFGAAASAGMKAALIPESARCLSRTAAARSTGRVRRVIGNKVADTIKPGLIRRLLRRCRQELAWALSSVRRCAKPPRA